MSKRVNLKVGDKIRICGEEYQLRKNLGARKGFQFRTWLIKNTLNKKEYVVKISKDCDKTLNELRILVYLKTKGYPKRYYAELVAFDYEAVHYRSNHNFYAILLKYLPEEKFQPLDEYLKGRVDKKRRKKLADKLRRRIRKLHELGVIHGDVRKANIMVTETKRGVGLRLIDFGLSRFGNKEEIQKDDKKVDNFIEKMISEGTLK